MKVTDDLRLQLKTLITDAKDKSQMDGLRTDLFDRYMGEAYGDEVEGRSKFIDTTVADAVEAILPDVMDVFTSSDRLQQFKPNNAQDVEAAKQESDAVSYMFWEENKGFENLYTWVKEALIQQNSYCWHGWVEKERVTIDEYEDLTMPELVSIIQGLDGEYEIIEQDGFEIKEDETGQEVAVPKLGDDGQPLPISVKIRCEKVDKEYVIEPFPQEDFFGTPRWGKVSLDGIPCCGRIHPDMRKPQLLAMGFSEDSIDDSSSDVDDTTKASRHSTQDSVEEESSVETTTIYETYALLDLYDNGKEVLCKVWAHKDGTEVLKWKDGTDAIEEVSRRPIAALTPYIMPHRHIGRSTAEQVDDIQQVNTVLLRHLLDNLYATNHGRPYYDENQATEQTFTDLQNPAHGAPVRTGGADIQWYTPPSVAPTVLPILEKFAAAKEERVGATRFNQGLDAQSLNKTVGGMGMMMNASQKKAKLVARTLAETGLRDLFLGIHADMRSGPIKDMMMQIRGQWVEIDPRKWPPRSSLRMEVGMGRGDRDETRTGLMALGQVQRELKAGGSPMVNDANIYATIERTMQTFGIDDISPFINDPRTMPPQQPMPPQPDPMLMGVQAQAQKYQADAQRDAAKIAEEARENQRKHERFLAEMQLKEAKMASDIQEDEDRLQLDREKAANEDDFKRDKLEIDAVTGYMRETAKSVTSTPAVSHDKMTDG